MYCTDTILGRNDPDVVQLTKDSLQQLNGMDGDSSKPSTPSKTIPTYGNGPGTAAAAKQQRSKSPKPPHNTGRKMDSEGTG